MDSLARDPAEIHIGMRKTRMLKQTDVLSEG